MHFQSLKIGDVRREADDAISINFEVERRLKRAFAFKQGQFLVLRAMVGGREVRRCYSICSGVDDGELRIAIKRVENGRFSTFALEHVRPGQVIDVAPPQGHFYLQIDPEAKRTYLLCATGSGITPIMSIIKSVLAREPGSRLLLFYGNRSRGGALFLEEIASLVRDYPGRLESHLFFSREAPGAGEYGGRIDARVIDIARAGVGSIGSVDACFLCGVTDMTAELRDRFIGAGLDPGRIFIELFDAPPEDGTLPPEVIRGASATLLLEEGPVELDLGSSTVVDAALERGIELPYSCRTGSCSTCLARLVEGSAHMMNNNALEQKWVDRGYVLSCQTRATSPRLVLDFSVRDVQII